MEVFAERIKFLRKEKSLSLMSLAKILNVSDTAILKWECNKSDPTAENIKNVAVFLMFLPTFCLAWKTSTEQKFDYFLSYNYIFSM